MEVGWRQTKQAAVGGSTRLKRLKRLLSLVWGRWRLGLGLGTASKALSESAGVTGNLRWLRNIYNIYIYIGIYRYYSLRSLLLLCIDVWVDECIYVFSKCIHC